MLNGKISSDFLNYIVTQDVNPGERFPSLADISSEMGVSVGKLREQFEVARMLGLVEASPRRGITRKSYDFHPPVRLSLLMALALDSSHFREFSSLRAHLETAYWYEAVVLLTVEDKAKLQQLVKRAIDQLNQARVQIPHFEHRTLHLTIFSRLENPFVKGLFESYWDAYEAVRLNRYADYSYLQKVWKYHAHIVDAICEERYDEGKELLVEHMTLFRQKHTLGPENNGVSDEDLEEKGLYVNEMFEDRGSIK